MSTQITFGHLNLGEVFTPLRGVFKGRTFRKTAVAPGTDRQGGNAAFLESMTRRDFSVLRHPGEHSRSGHLTFRDADEISVPDPFRAAELRQAVLDEQRRARSKKKEWGWFFDLSPADVRRIEEEQALPKHRSKAIRRLRGAS
jgi:hypothetical protein